MKRYLLPFLLLLQPLLGLGFASLWFTPEGQSKIPVWQPPAPLAPELVNTLPVYSPAENPQDIVTLSERPLFSSHRRAPIPPKAPEAPPPPDPLDKTYINGLLNGSVTVIIASVEGHSRQLRLKDKVRAWELSNVGERSVTFSRNDDKRELPLSYTSLGATRLVNNTPDAGTANATTATIAPPPSGAISDERREILRRRNEIRAKAGLPPLPEQ